MKATNAKFLEIYVQYELLLLTLLALLLVLLILVFDELVVVGVDIVKLLELDSSDSD